MGFEVVEDLNADIRVCTLSGYPDIRKPLSVQIPNRHYSEKLVIGFFILQITGLRFSIQRYLYL